MSFFINKRTITHSIISIIVFFLFFLSIEILSVGYIDFNYIKIFLFCSIVINIASFLFVSQKQYYRNFVFVFLFFISILCIKLITHSILDYDVVKFLIVFYIGITNINLILFCVFNKKFKILSYIIQFVLFFPTLFIWEYFFISNGFINTETILAVFQTNFGEAEPYLQDVMGIKQYISLIILLFISVIIIKINNKLKTNNINKKLIILLLISIILNIFLIYRYRYNMITNIVLETKEYLQEYNNFKKLVSERNISNIKFEQLSNINKGVYVLVLGESQNKDHMSAYGYDKETTPWLKSMEKDKNFIKFENVYSCHTHTIPVLSYALTSKNQYNNIDLSKAVSILEIANALDIQTVWLSNQIHYGGWDTPVSVIADIAQQQKWINTNFGISLDTNYYDIKLVKEINNIKVYENMLIVIHLFGNHAVYKDRYPKEFDVFKNQEFADYDNSILYNDYVVKNIFEIVKKIPNFKALIYCADHADAVDQGLYHDAVQYVPSMTHIPTYMYLTDSYIKDNPQIYMNLCNNKTSYWTNDLLFNLILGIINIKVSDLYEQENDITNNKYNDTISRFRTLHGKKSIVDMETILKYYNIIPCKYANTRNITIPKHSIWLHRVNTKKRLKYYLNQYIGFEIDIKFNNKKYFNVSHDNIEGDENLADMLKDITGLEQKYLWLDFKNLGQNNKNDALIVLNKIIEDNNLLKEHIIIESNTPAALDVFSKSGYYTSFYLNCYSWDDINNLPNLLSDSMQKLNKSNVDFVSSDANYFDIVKYCFPNSAHLFWVMDGEQTQQNKTDYIFETDNNAYVVLNQNRNKYYK